MVWFGLLKANEKPLANEKSLMSNTPPPPPGPGAFLALVVRQHMIHQSVFLFFTGGKSGGNAEGLGGGHRRYVCTPAVVQGGPGSSEHDRPVPLARECAAGWGEEGKPGCSSFVVCCWFWSIKHARMFVFLYTTPFFMMAPIRRENVGK